MSRSSLENHSFPHFYACYLLKSVKTPRATATYIGSTPNPPRRLRQHNGELTQGAWKTKHHRPWVMQMIVYGFPSKLSALQFEWAWQHPYISRHLRDEDGGSLFRRKTKSLKSHILVACGMVASHPYNTWPLRAKFFTEDAYKQWNTAVKSIDMPLGFGFSVELEGVDGRSGKAGSGRSGPIDVTDSEFVGKYLKKASDIRLHPLCTICEESVDSAQPLSSALCPTDDCTAISHLTCLAKAFCDTGSTSSSIIPRGGTCRSCGMYTLWGDVIRGCYRRSASGVVVAEEDSDILEEELNASIGSETTDDPSDEDLAVATPVVKLPRKPKSITRKPIGRPKTRAATSKGTKRTYHTQATTHRSSDEREFFDLDAVSSSEDSFNELDIRATNMDRTPSPSRRAVTPPYIHNIPPDIEDSPSTALNALSSLSISSPDASAENLHLPATSKHCVRGFAGSTTRSRAREYIEISD